MSDWNLNLFQEIYKLAHKSPLLDGLIVFLANYMAYLMVLGFFVLLFKESSSRRRFFWFFTTAISLILSRGIVTETIRFFYNHARPMDALPGITALLAESGNSFPSGHMAFLFALSFSIWLMNRRWGIFYMILSLIVGIARIASGVHWPADILSGILVGLLSGWIVWVMSRKYFPGDVRAGQFN